MANVHITNPMMPSEMREHEHDTAQERTNEVAAGSSFTGSIAGLGAVVLAILGLLGLVPTTLAAIATIVVGGALLLEGGAIAARAARAYSPTRTSTSALREVPTELSGGVSSEMLAAIAGIALGILSLVGVMPMTLLPVALIVLGAGLLFGSAATSQMSSTTGSTLVRDSLYAASGAHVLIGLTAIVLGILGLLGTSPVTLTLVAALAVGGSIVLSGAAVGGRIMSTMR